MLIFFKDGKNNAGINFANENIAGNMFTSKNDAGLVMSDNNAKNVVN